VQKNTQCHKVVINFSKRCFNNVLGRSHPNSLWHIWCFKQLHKWPVQNKEVKHLKKNSKRNNRTWGILKVHIKSAEQSSWIFVMVLVLLCTNVVYVQFSHKFTVVSCDALVKTVDRLALQYGKPKATAVQVVYNRRHSVTWSRLFWQWNTVKPAWLVALTSGDQISWTFHCFQSVPAWLITSWPPGGVHTW